MRTRRVLLWRTGTITGATAASAILGGCNLRTVWSAVPRMLSRQVTLRVYLPTLAEAGTTQTEWRALFKQAMKVALKEIPRAVEVSYVVGEGPRQWFPRGASGPPATLFNFTGKGSPVHPPVEDPSIPMPDIVVAPHFWLEGYLAVRAQDLSPALKVAGRALPQSTLRLGRAYAGKRGTIQAGLPMLRQPMVCRAPHSALTVARGSRPWGRDAFALFLRSLSKQYPSGPLADVPFATFTRPFSAAHTPPTPLEQLDVYIDSGLAGALALDAGGRLARSNEAVFATAPALQGILSGIRWLASVTPYSNPSCKNPGVMRIGEYAVFLGFFARSIGVFPVGWTMSGKALPLQEGVPVPHGPFGRRGSVLMPLPGTRSPVSTLDVMVWKGSKYADTATQLAIALVGPAAQRVLATWGRALAVHSGVAVQQLGQWTDGTNAALLADTERDATMEDMYGALTDSGLAQQGKVRGSLLSGLKNVAKYAGGFVVGCWGNARPLSPEAAKQVLAKAQRTANGA